MKLKKLISAVIAGTMLMGSMITSVTAATKTLTFSPTKSGTHYVISVSAYVDTMLIDYVPGKDTVTISSNAIENAIVNLSTYNNWYNNMNFKVTNARLNTSPITSQTVGFGYTATENILTGGNLTRFSWSADLVYTTDPTIHPETGLGIYLSDINIPIELKINATSSDKSFSTPLYNFSAKVATGTATVSTIKSGTTLKVSDYFNSPYGFDRDQKESIRNGSNFKVTVNLAKFNYGNEIYRLSTDNVLSGSTTIGQYLKSTVVFENVPKEFFFDDVIYQKYGTDTTFSALTVTGGAEYTSIVIEYTEGTATPSTDNNTSNNTNNNTDNNEAEYVAESEMTINMSSVTLNPGASTKIITNMDDAKFTTSNKNIVKVYTNGKITAVKAGNATITAKNSAGDKVTCKVTVKSSSTPATSFKLSKSAGTIYVGGSYNLPKYSISPSSSTDVVTWSSSDPSIARVYQTGKVTAVSAGKVTITATSSSGISSTMTLTCKNPSLTLSSKNATIGVNESVRISYSLKPAKGNVTFESSNEAVAEVDSNGNVYGVKRGTAKISVTAPSGIIKVFTVTVV